MTKKYILVAEDDKFYANVYRTKLANEGFDVTVVENGKLALEEIGKKKPNLILLDLVMPVMDGFETLKNIRADEGLKDLKVLVLSNLGQEEDIKKVKDLGATEYIVKSNLSIDEMMEVIKKYV
jgi:CheY-like chemotaxis protein